MSKKSLGYVHMQWTCPYCDAKNKGSDKKCHSCAAAQPDDVQFEQMAQDEIITDETTIAKAKAGADIHCAYCGTRNSAETAVCEQCGADLSEGAARQAGQVVGAHRTEAAAPIACRYCGTENPADAATCQNCGANTSEEQSPPPSPPPPAKKKSKAGMMIGIAVAIFLLIICCLFLVLSSRTEDQQARVDAVECQRSINVEALGDVSRDKWRDEIPSDAIRVGSCTSKEHHTQANPPSSGDSTEVCGTPYNIDQGNGMSEVVQDCEYVVYAEWCEYTITEWTVVDEVNASGNDLNPSWPNVSLSSGEREGARDESYTIHFSDDGERFTYHTSDEAEYVLYRVGTDWVLKVNTFGSINEVVAP